MSPVADLLNKKVFAGVCVHCKKVAFNFFEDPFKVGFENATPIVPNTGPVEEDKINNITKTRKAFCGACGHKINIDTDLTIAIEHNQVRHLFIVYQLLSNYVKSADTLAMGHKQMLLFYHMLGLSKEDWEKNQDMYDKIARESKALATIFSERCIQLGCKRSED